MILASRKSTLEFTHYAGIKHKDPIYFHVIELLLFCINKSKIKRWFEALRFSVPTPMVALILEANPATSKFFLATCLVANQYATILVEPSASLALAVS